MRCPWPSNDPLMIKYHDEEWGQPLHDDRKLFEFLILESFQAGLSWKTVLYKRGNFRKAFANFDAKKVSRFDKKKFNVCYGEKIPHLQVATLVYSYCAKLPKNIAQCI